MMDCKQILSLLPSDLVGEDSRSVALKIAEHLRECRSCSIVYESARETVERISGEPFGDSCAVWRNREADIAGELPARELQTGGGK